MWIAQVVIRRLLEDDQFSAAGEALLTRNLWNAVRDWRTWLCMLIYAGVVGPLYAFALFLPSIINEVRPSRLFWDAVCT